MEHFTNPFHASDLRGDTAAENHAFFAGLLERTRAHAFFAHPLLSFVPDASPAARDFVTFMLTSFYHVVEPFTGLLCSLAARAPALRSRFVLMDNVFEELGCGDIGAAHPNLYLSMLASVSVSEQRAGSAQVLPAIGRIRAHLAHVVEHCPFAVACAVLASAESTIPASFPMLARAAQQAFPGVDMRFFDRHGERDDGHASDAATLFAVHALPSQWLSTEQEVIRDLDHRVELLDAWMAAAPPACR